MNPTELVGRCFIWEPKNANAMESIVVVAVNYNADQEWWIESANLTTGKRSWNELSRFNEATSLNGTEVGELLNQQD